jgi:hypothetical protein
MKGAPFYGSERRTFASQLPLANYTASMRRTSDLSGIAAMLATDYRVG